MAIEDNKTNKRNNLLNASYELFTTIGFQNTTISKITTTANVGKGTFYLYFNNKDEIRHALIVEKSSHLIKNAIKILNEKIKDENLSLELSDKILFIVDYIITHFKNDRPLLEFIAKNLSWGFISTKYLKSQNQNDNVIEEIKNLIHSIETKEKIKIKDPMLMIFTVIELVNSTCYNVILHDEPVHFDDYKDYLYKTIKLIVKNSVENENWITYTKLESLDSLFFWKIAVDFSYHIDLIHKY